MIDPVFSVLFLTAVVCPIAAIVYLLKPVRRSTQAHVMAIACAVAGPMAFVLYAGPVLFVSNDGAMEIYVLTPERNAHHFTEELAALSKRYGMEPHLAQMPEPHGTTYFVMDASGYRLNIWSTNMPLSAQENADECGHYSEPHSDPGQYVLRVSKMMPFGTKQAIREMTSQIGTDLASMGYEVRTTPVTCSPLSKIRALH